MEQLKYKKGEHLHNLKAPYKQVIPAPTTVWYFAYGSNMDRARMFQRKAVWNYCTSGTLKNFKLNFSKTAKNHGQGFANIIKSKQHQVEGVLYRLEDSHLYKQLDKHECAGTHYNRVEKKIRRSDGKIITAFLYTAILTSKNLKPTEEYLNHLLKGEKYLSPDYVSFLKSFQTAYTEDLKVFVYGTLKKGFGNHKKVESATKIQKATISGKLYNTGLPYVTMNREDFSTVGTVNLDKDIKNFNSLDCEDFVLSEECVHGELLTFTDWNILKSLDTFEGFNPTFMQSNLDAIFESNHYTRVLTTCVPDDSKDFEPEPCWIYIVSASKNFLSGKAQVKSGKYEKVQTFSKVYHQEDLTRFEEGLDKHDTEYYEPELSYDYLSQDYGIVNSLTEKGEL